MCGRRSTRSRRSIEPGYDPATLGWARVRDLPARPPFAVRARILTALDAGGFRHDPDAVLAVEVDGRIARIGPPGGDAVDLRPWLLLPGLVDCHAHLPQLPAAGTGAGRELLPWLEE